MIGAWRRGIRGPLGTFGVVTVAVLAAAALSLGVIPAVSAATVSPNSVSVVSEPGVSLVAPADGRLRGDHPAADVTGVAVVTRVGGAKALQAASGQRLVVFGLQGAHLGQTAADGKAIPPVTGTLVVDGQRTALPKPSSDDGTTPIYYRASVAAAAKDVQVELAASGLAQAFSLTQRTRVGAQPVVLYRDRQTWQPLVQVNAEQDVTTPDPADRLPGAILPIKVHDVYLSWFGPDSPADVRVSANQAWTTP